MSIEKSVNSILTAMHKNKRLPIKGGSYENKQCCACVKIFINKEEF